MKTYLSRIIQFVCLAVLLLNGIYSYVVGKSVFFQFVTLWFVLVVIYVIYEFKIAPNREQLGYIKGKLEGTERMQQMLKEFNSQAIKAKQSKKHRR